MPDAEYVVDHGHSLHCECRGMMQHARFERRRVEAERDDLARVLADLIHALQDEAYEGAPIWAAQELLTRIDGSPAGGTMEP